MIKQINNITGEEIEISEEEFMEMLSSGEVTLSGIQQVVTNADGEQRTNQLYGTDMLNDDRWDRSVNIFGATSAVFRPGLLKARKVKEENVDEEYIFQMDNSVQNYEIVVDDMELPNMHILKFTEESVQIASYIRDEQKSVGTPINEKEYRFENGRLSARIEDVTADTALLNVFGVYETVKLLEERNLLQELKNKENMGTGVLLNVIAEGTAEEYIETRVVCGLERPELPCVMFGGLFAESMDDVIMMRPYPDEVFNSWMPGMDNSYDRFGRLKKRVEAGEQGALGQLAKEYMQAGSETFGEEQDEYYRLCIENAQKAIENGDLYGYWLLALTYERGRGVEPDVEKAIAYYKEGSKLGEHNCQNSLACYFMRGEGVAENRGAAFKLFEKAALQGNKLAEFSLSKCYENGHGTEVNIEKAIEWGEKAAVDASADVQYEVGKLYTYTDDNGKMINAERARYWLSQAAIQGHDMAYGMLTFSPMWEEDDSPNVACLKKKKAFVEFLEEFKFSSDEHKCARVDKEQGIAVFSVEVQGTQYEGRTDRIEYVTQGQQIAVSREPENEYNSDNIAVLNKQGESLGNLSAGVCNALSPLLDSNLAEIKDAHVSFVTPLSKRRKNAKKAILYVELTVKLAETKLTEEDGSVVCLLGGDQIRIWAQKLDVIKTTIPFTDAKALFELHNRYHKEYEKIVSGEETDYGYVGLDNLVEEIIDAKAKMKDAMEEDLDYSVSCDVDSFGEYIMEMADEEPERYGNLTKYVDMMSVDDYFENRLDNIFKRHEVECNTYYWLDQTRVTDKGWDAETMAGFNHWYDVAELYSPEQELPFDLKDEDIVSIFGFGKFKAFADLSYGC